MSVPSPSSSGSSTTSASSGASAKYNNPESKTLNALSRRGLVMKSPFFQMESTGNDGFGSTQKRVPSHETALNNMKLRASTSKRNLTWAQGSLYSNNPGLAMDGHQDTNRLSSYSSQQSLKPPAPAMTASTSTPSFRQKQPQEPSLFVPKRNLDARPDDLFNNNYTTITESTTTVTPPPPASSSRSPSPNPPRIGLGLGVQDYEELSAKTSDNSVRPNASVDDQQPIVITSAPPPLAMSQSSGVGAGAGAGGGAEGDRNIQKGDLQQEQADYQGDRVQGGGLHVLNEKAGIDKPQKNNHHVDQHCEEKFDGSTESNTLDKLAGLGLSHETNIRNSNSASSISSYSSSSTFPESTAGHEPTTTTTSDTESPPTPLETPQQTSPIEYYKDDGDDQEEDAGYESGDTVDTSIVEADPQEDNDNDTEKGDNEVDPDLTPVPRNISRMPTATAATAASASSSSTDHFPLDHSVLDREHGPLNFSASVDDLNSTPRLQQPPIPPPPAPSRYMYLRQQQSQPNFQHPGHDDQFTRSPSETTDMSRQSVLEAFESDIKDLLAMEKTKVEQGQQRRSDIESVGRWPVVYGSEDAGGGAHAQFGSGGVGFERRVSDELETHQRQSVTQRSSTYTTHSVSMHSSRSRSSVNSVSIFAECQPMEASDVKEKEEEEEEEEEPVSPIQSPAGQGRPKQPSYNPPPPPRPAPPPPHQQPYSGLSAQAFHESRTSISTCNTHSSRSTMSSYGGEEVTELDPEDPRSKVPATPTMSPTLPVSPGCRSVSNDSSLSVTAIRNSVIGGANPTGEIKLYTPPGRQQQPMAPVRENQYNNWNDQLLSHRQSTSKKGVSANPTPPSGAAVDPMSPQTARKLGRISSNAETMRTSGSRANMSPQKQTRSRLSLRRKGSRLSSLNLTGGNNTSNVNTNSNNNNNTQTLASPAVVPPMPPTPSPHQLLSATYESFLNPWKTSEVRKAAEPQAPEQVTLWFLRQLISSKTTPAGAYLSSRMYMPSEIWQIDTLSPRVLEPRLKCINELTKVASDKRQRANVAALEKTLEGLDASFQAAFLTPLSDSNLSGVASPQRRRSSAASASTASSQQQQQQPVTPVSTASRNSGSQSVPSSRTNSSSFGSGMFRRLRKKSSAMGSMFGGSEPQPPSTAGAASSRASTTSNESGPMQRFTLSHYLTAISSLASALESLQQQVHDTKGGGQWLQKYRQFVAHVACRLILKDMTCLQDIYKHDFREYLLN